MFLGVSSPSTREAGGPGQCGSGVFIGEEIDGVGDKGSDNTTTADSWTLFEALLKDSQAWSLGIQIKGIIL
jgi:hypothetical protein